MREHEGKKVAYVSCATSGCALPGGCCLLKAHLKDGRIAALEMGDSINQGMAREDISQEALRAQLYQHRPCQRAYTWRETIYHPDRARYPMKSVGARGERKFVRISWDEALDTVADKIKAIGGKYGSHCILGDLPLLQWAGPWGFRTWGNSSFSGFILPDLLTLGHCMGSSVEDDEVQECADIFNTKLVLWFGANPAVTERELAYWLTHAKERGVPIIFVDPVYSVSAEVYADQWIPIRAGTDLAMLLALANVLFKENLYDRGYVARFVEPTGFRKWQDYVLGRAAGPDGKVDRSPEWAEKICGVPAETMWQLARLYARSKPCSLRLHRSATRQLYAENGARVSIYLQAMTGNLGVSGGGPGNEWAYSHKMMIPVPAIDWQNEKPRFPSECILFQRGWVDAILLRDKLNRGEITDDEYRRTCGIAQQWPLPNIHMVWASSQPNFKYVRMAAHRSGRPTLSKQDLNAVLEALDMVDFIVSPVYFQSSFPSLFSDILLPLADGFFEEARGYLSGTGAASNHFVCGFKAIEPPGEARPLEWINVQLARRLGVAEQYSPRLADVIDDYPGGWDRRIEGLLQEAYEKWSLRSEIAPRNPPSWEEFCQQPLYRVPYEGPLSIAFGANIQKGKLFDTPSGRIEFYSDFLADPEMGRKSYILPQRKIDDRCCFGGSVPPVIPPMAEWMLPVNSLLAQRAEKYPLTMLTPHSFHRQNTSQDNNPWVRDELRHSLHISVADAKARFIRDGETVRAYNDRGEVRLPAYVTSRITPGVVLVPHGAWPELSRVTTERMPAGVDQRGADNFLVSSRSYPWVVGVERCADLVEVEKLRE